MTATTRTTTRSTGPHLKDQDKPASPAHGKTHSSVKGEDTPRTPNERDESSDSQHSEPREVIQQAHRDVEAGLVDTDKGTPMDQTYKKLGPAK